MSESLHALTQRASTWPAGPERGGVSASVMPYPLITNADAADWTAADRFEALPQIFTSSVYLRTEAVEHTPERARTNAMPLFDNVSQ